MENIVNKDIKKIVNTSKQERFLEMYQNFMSIDKEDRVFVAGLIQGMYLKKKENETRA